MKNKIHYAVEALRDLDDIWDYIVTDLCNASAAERVVNDILDVVEQLENFSEMGALLGKRIKRDIYNNPFHRETHLGNKKGRFHES